MQKEQIALPSAHIKPSYFGKFEEIIIIKQAETNTFEIHSIYFNS